MDAMAEAGGTCKVAHMVMHYSEGSNINIRECVIIVWAGGEVKQGAKRSKSEPAAAIERKDSTLSISSTETKSPDTAEVAKALKRPNTVEQLAESSRASKILKKVGNGKGYGKEFSADPLKSRPVASPQQQPAPDVQPLSLRQATDKAMKLAKSGCCAELPPEKLKEVVDGYVRTVAHVAEHWIGQQVIDDLETCGSQQPATAKVQAPMHAPASH